MFSVRGNVACFFKITLDTEINFARAFDTEIFVLHITGLYPDVKKTTCWQIFRQILYITITLIQLSSGIIQIFISHDFDQLLDCGIDFIHKSNLFLKVIQVYAKAKTLEALRVYIENIDQSNIPDGFRHILVRKEFIRSTFGYAYRAALLVFMLLQLSITCFQDERKFLPVLSWIPFDINIAKNYYLVLAYQMIVFVICVLSDTSIDCLYLIVADIACCQLDILKENVKQVDPDTKSHVKEELIRISKYHQEIIIFVSNIEKVFSPILFCEFFKSIVEICFLGFSLTMIEFPSSKFFMQSIYFFAILIEIFSFCWFGHQLLTKSIEIEDECYMIKWDEMDIKLLRILLIIMIRAHKPLVVQAGFLTLSMTTLTAILRSSYSFMAVLRRFYNN